MNKRRIQESMRFMRDMFHKELDKDIKNLMGDMLEGYDSLSMIVYDPESKANPDMYREYFEEKLDSFEFLKIDNSDIVLTFIDVKNFDYTGIEFLEFIVEGTIEEYYEISTPVVSILERTTTLNKIPISSYLEEPYYIIKASNELRDLAKSVAGVDLVVFPFSGVGSLEDNIFGPVEKFKEVNDERIQKIIKKCNEDIARKFRGKIL